MGGNFSEGIDLTGERRIGAAIVGKRFPGGLRAGNLRIIMMRKQNDLFIHGCQIS